LDHMTDTGFARITDPAPAGGWAFCTVAPDDSARLGEWVIATGNPGSIVLDRNPPLRIGRVTAHDAKKIETNCALEPGDSGGPVFNLQGQVVGINSRIMASDTDIHLKEYLSVHVPVSLFTSQWKDLLAGANEHPDFVLGRKSGPGRGRGGNPQAARFREAMDKLIAARDPEILKLLADSQKNGGRLPLTPELMQHLIQKAGLAPGTTQPTTARSDLAQAPATQPIQPTTAPAVQKGIAAALRPRMGAEIKRSLLQQFPDAKITDAILNRIMDHSSVDPVTHRVNLVTEPQDLKDMGISAEAIAARTANLMPTNRAAAEVGKMSLPTLSLFVPALESAGDCMVEIRSADKPVLLGTIVDPDGWIVTKASDLPDHPAVVLADGRHLIARLIGKDSVTDLALLKVSATGLTPVRFTDATPLGSFLVAPTEDSNQPAIGVVSDTPRPITEKLSHFAGEQKLVLGIGFAGPNLILGMITPGMPAEAANG
jgi:S1-C subfamily serine protease